VFIVLNGKARRNPVTVSHSEIVAEESLSPGQWAVHFAPAINPDSGADYTFEDLPDWSESEDDFIRFFSGTATYKSTFNWNSCQATAVELDLGKVYNMAHVYLNGQDLGLLWKEPYKVDISQALQEGANSLEIKVTNSWGNRLIGDSALPEEERETWTSWEFYSPEDPLPASGLSGPVKLITKN